jgi:hypothetical protein
MALTPNTYAIATGLVGFRSSELRVKVTRAEGEYVWVVTADLQDAGTFLVLSASQVEAEPQATAEVLSHKTGLVAFA